MSKVKRVAGLLFVLLLLGGLVVAVASWILDDDNTIRVFGYNVYRFGGSGHYAIFYPLPNGTVKLLKTGRAGILPVLVKIPRESWLKEYSKHPAALKALPTPLVIFVNDKGIGVESLHGSKITLKPFQIPIGPNDKPCPGGYVPIGSRYCIPKNPTANWINIIASKTITEPLSFLGLEIDNQVLKNVSFTIQLTLGESTYSYWTVGIDVAGFSVRTAKLGENFQGKAFGMEYTTAGFVNPDGLTWSRFVNLYVEYEVVVFGVLAYDRYTGKFTRIPVTATYPLEILSTGRYTVYETENGPKFVEGNESWIFAPTITTQPNYYEIPSSASITSKYIHANGSRLIFNKWSVAYWGLSSYSSLSIPLGSLAFSALDETGVLSKYPSVLKELDILSLTISFSQHSNEISGFTYSLKAVPQRDCSVLFYNTPVRTEDYGYVGVPMLFVTVTDGKSGGICIPHTGVCTETHNKQPQS